MKKDDSLTGMYYDYALAAPVMAGVNGKEEAEILVLGMGTGTYAKQCIQYFGNVSVEGVEIDQKITDLAGEYFALPDTVEVTTYDGRAYLQAIDQKYDVIMVDAYQDITIPFQMSSIEFFTLVRDHLKEDGIMVVNMNMHSEEEGNINEYLSDTIANVFDEVYTVDVRGSTNRELFASTNAGVLDIFMANVEGLENDELTDMMQRVSEGLVEYKKGELLLTDDKAPVELLGMSVIDGIIQDEIGYYKKIFKEEGIEGILNSM